jgi:hypothetical protein
MQADEDDEDDDDRAGEDWDEEDEEDVEAVEEANEEDGEEEEEEAQLDALLGFYPCLSWAKGQLTNEEALFLFMGHVGCKQEFSSE